jgi:membrane protein
MPKWRWVTPGSVIATLLWVGGSTGFSYFIANFSNYNDTYGSIGGVIVLLMWLYLSAYIVLLGAQFNAATEHQTQQDTTHGTDQPIGDRGAYVADTTPDTKDDSSHR